MSEYWPWITLAALGAYHGVNPGMGWLFAVALGLQEQNRKAVTRAFLPIAIGHAASIIAVVLLVAALRTVVSPQILRYTGASALVLFGLYKLLAPMSHPRWARMRVSARQLAAWSFLMATAHGAGLMVVPVLLKMDSPAAHAATLQPASIVQAAPEHGVMVTKIEDDGRSVKVEMSCHETDAAHSPIREAGGSDAKPAAGATAAAPNCHSQIEDMAGGGAGFALGGVVLHTLAMFGAMALVALVVYDKVGLAVLRTAWFNLDLLWAGALIGAGVLTFFV